MRCDFVQTIEAIRLAAVVTVVPPLFDLAERFMTASTEARFNVIFRNRVGRLQVLNAFHQFVKPHALRLHV